MLHGIPVTVPFPGSFLGCIFCGAVTRSHLSFSRHQKHCDYKDRIAEIGQKLKEIHDKAKVHSESNLEKKQARADLKKARSNYENALKKVAQLEGKKSAAYKNAAKNLQASYNDDEVEEEEDDDDDKVECFEV
jgi:hypothetical protein